MRLSRSLVVALILAVAVARPASAQSVTAGSPTGQNCYPFGCMLNGAVYQQVYAGSLFGTSPFSITSLTFLTAVYAAQGQSFDLFLSATAAAVGGLSRNVASNVGSRQQLFATFTPLGTYTSSITIVGNAFVFDPTAGNLLLQVVVNGAGRTSQFFAADDGNGISSRAFDPDGPAGAGRADFDDASLVTVFGGGPVTSTPEPATLTLMATGLASLIGITKRRRRAG